ncbi:MAG TPA: FxLYD domain-containing protein [Bryobacteraceae bacterium]|nr:FxLYD domain-containing protein [Bryobacteraceae bacterium]
MAANSRCGRGVLPGLVIVTIFAGRAFVQVGQASRAVSGNATSKPSKSLACVEAYSVTLTNSQFYVPEGQEFTPRTTTEPSTVVSGMVRNDCGETLKSVTIHINVRDEAGKRGDGSVTVSDLNSGEAKPFSKAWMGRVTSYEIGKIQ